MIRFMIQKLLHKKWMVICLLIGNILMVAIACSNPMYKNASLQRTLITDFSDYIETENEYPGMLSISSAMKPERGMEQEFASMRKLSGTIAEDFDLDQTENVAFYATVKNKAMSMANREDNTGFKSLRICSMTNLDKHANFISGRMCSDEKDAEGNFEIVVSQRCMVKQNLLLNEVIQFPDLLDASGNPMKFKVVGVFENKEQEDPYWVTTPTQYFQEVFTSEKIFLQNFVSESNQPFSITADWYVFFNYESLTPGQVNKLITNTEQTINTTKTKNSGLDRPVYLDILKQFQLSSKKISTTLLILQVPVMALLCAFIFMISRQMLDLEQNEIALLKSRGSSKIQIITIYLLQSAIISLISFLAGLPIGAFMCKALGSTNGFLKFISRKALDINLSVSVFLYALGAMVVSISFMVLPVFRDANVTIVNYKQNKNQKKKNIIQRAYIDVILLAVSVYGLYTFTDRKDALMQQMLKGGSLDPFVFICSSLFIISMALVALRIQPLLVKLVYIIGKKRWRPSFFASFLQILRTGGKQSFMMVFLMLTVSLGIFNATVARTILTNSESGIRYATGADIVFQQKWEDNSAFVENDPELTLTYTEPDFSQYETMDGVKAVTKVYRDDKITTKLKAEDVTVGIEGIDTKRFGETLWFKDTLLPKHINEYLNVLSKNSEGVLLTDNFRTKYEVKLGDTFTYSNKDGVSVDAKVLGFVQYWPGYLPVTHETNDEGSLVAKDNYLVIGHFSKMQQALGTKPYEVWMKTNGSSQFIYDYAEKNNVTFTYFHDVASELVDVRNDTLFQGTNGILTMSFIVVLILCCTGFLIYWILSIRSRELLFGVFRAMGMTKKEIIHMLVNEQIFSSGLSIIIGTGIGVLAANLFVPLVQIFYASTEQALPLIVVNQASDMVRLFSMIILVIIVCMVVLGMLISKIRISQALKLGED